MGNLASVAVNEHGAEAGLLESTYIQSYGIRSVMLTEEDNSTEDTSEDSSTEEDESWITSIVQEDVRVQKENIFKALNEAIAKINQLPDLRDEHGNWLEDLGHVLREFRTQMTALQNMGQLAYGVIEYYRREAGHLISKSNSLNILRRVVMEGWTIYRKDKEMLQNQFEVIMLALQNLVTFSDSSAEVKCDIAKDGGFLETLTEILKSCFKPNFRKEEEWQIENRLVKHSLLILTNVSQVDENIKLLQSLNNVDIIAKYLSTIFRLMALTYIANIVNEDGSAKLQGKDSAIETIQELSNLLRGAINDPNHRCTDECNITWSPQECAQTIRVLARNEKSKTMLREAGCLPPLVVLASCGTVDETKEAVGAIWALSFDKENQKTMVKDKTLNIVTMLLDLQKGLDNVRKATDGALWNIRDLLKQNEAYKDLDFLRERNVPNSADVGKSCNEEADARRKKGHVMISYNSKHRKEAEWIKNQLEANKYPVWMDIGNMGGSTLQTMAEAVESAFVFLFCYSEEYKNSNNCRMEAEYAVARNVHMIPLLMEKNYKAEGWLGFCVGSKYYYDFSGKYTLEKKLQELLAKLNEGYMKGGFSS